MSNVEKGNLRCSIVLGHVPVARDRRMASTNASAIPLEPFLHPTHWGVLPGI